MADSGNNVTQRIPGRNGGTLIPFRKGVSGNPAGVSAERRELYEAIERRQVPRVLAMLDALFERGLGGANIDDMAANMAAKLWLDQVRGPVKARDDDKIAMAVEEKLLEMIQEARRRKAENSRAGARPETSETDPPK